MVSYNVPSVLIWVTLGFVLLLLGAIVTLIINIFNRNKSDKILLLDKNNRWEIIDAHYYGQSEWTHDHKQYFLVPECGILSKKGKSMYVFSENKPAPMKLEYNKTEWLDSTSLKAILNNDLIQKMLETKNKGLEMLQTLGAFAAIFTLLLTVIILLKVMGVLK